MANDENSSSNDALSKKLDAERRKLDSERVKLDLEAEQIRKRSPQWHYIGIIVKWTAGGLGGTALFFYYFLPIYNLEQEVALLENQKLAQQTAIDKQQNDQRTQELQERTEQLQAENEAVKEELAFLASDRENLQALLTKTEESKTELVERYGKLASDYDALAQQQQLTEQERVQFASLARSVSADVDVINREIEELQSALQESEARVQTIQTQLETREIRGMRIGISHNEKSKEDAIRIQQLLTDLGANVLLTAFPETGPLSSIRGSPPTMNCYNNSKSVAAAQIQKAIADIVQVEVVQTVPRPLSPGWTLDIPSQVFPPSLSQSFRDEIRGLPPGSWIVRQPLDCSLFLLPE